VRSRLALLILAIPLVSCGSTITKTETVRSAATIERQVYLPSICVDDKIRPTSFVPIACADGQSGVEYLKWTGWGDPVAKGIGYAYANDCQPDCVSGGTHTTPAEIYVSTVERCPGGRLQYEHATIAVANGPAVINGHTIGQIVGGAYSIPCPSPTSSGAQAIDPGP
jgi:hypothetical protein